jgi:hypothetical protein
MLADALAKECGLREKMRVRVLAYDSRAVAGYEAVGYDRK